MTVHYQRPIIGYLPHQPGNLFCFSRAGNQIKAYKITATSPPTIVTAWSVTQTGQGSPWVTTTDGTNNAIVWVVGAQGDQRLHGYNGDTGAVIYAGGGANELMTGTRKWNSGMVARGSIYVANDNKVYAFRVPGGTPTPTPTATATATPTLHQRLLQQLRRLLTATATSTATATPTPTPTATATAHANCTPTPTATATVPEVRQRHPDQRPLRDPTRHRGRGRLRRRDRQRDCIEDQLSPIGTSLRALVAV